MTEMTDISRPCLTISHVGAAPGPARKGIPTSRQCEYYNYGVL